MVDLATAGKKVIRKWTTREGLFGDFDYLYLFTPDLPFTRKQPKTQPFFGLHSDMPIFLGLILGFQHALAMLAGLVTPPIIISVAANFPPEIQQYLISASLICSGLMTIMTVSKIPIPFTKYFIGTGLLTVLGTSFATISVVNNFFPMLYANGICKTIDGVPQSCPEGYGYVLATSSVCALIEILLSFSPPAILSKVFPPLVTGPVVLLIGGSLIGSGFSDWVGGSDCVGEVCGTAKPYQWGSAQFIGLGFLVYVTIILCEKWGSPIMKSCSVVVGLLVGCIFGAGFGYFSHENIDMAPSVTFLWVHTFPLKVYGPLVLPMIAVYIVSMMECIGDITATSDVSRLEVEGPVYQGRIQGGVLADGISGVLTSLFTMTPMATFAQNNGVISVTKCANRMVGYWCTFFLLIMGIFAKFSAAITSIPKPILGGMTSFLFCAVAVSGIKIICTTEFTRRDRFILTAVLVPGFGAMLVPTWFSNVFGYSGDNRSLQGFLDAIVLVMETGFAVTGFLAVILNQFLPQVPDEIEEINEVVIDTVGSTNERALLAYASKEAEMQQNAKQME